MAANLALGGGGRQCPKNHQSTDESNSYPVLLRVKTPGRPEKITLANKAYLAKARKPLVSLRSPVVRVRRRRGVGGGQTVELPWQQTTVLVCATAVPTKGSERLLATRPQSRARGRRTKAAATSGCFTK